ncbi:divalent-cation tolerance protein CutA [Candidatus Woesearchaeota archaeon]|nr:divalent-cation tolerance protein CutA [Candidatus Woesearchaeota archaeon]
MITLYITFKDENEAKKIAFNLMEKRLIACANIFPIKSVYRWKGSVTDTQEHAMMAKALRKNFHIIKEEVKAMHSYEIPCIVAYPIAEADEGFRKWVEDETK